MTYRTLLLTVSMLVSLTACGSAQMLRADAHGGRIRVTGAYMESTREARSLMRDHCHGTYAAYASGSSSSSPTHLSSAPNRDQTTFDFVCAPASGSQQVARADGASTSANP